MTRLQHLEYLLNKYEDRNCGIYQSAKNGNGQGKLCVLTGHIPASVSWDIVAKDKVGDWFKTQIYFGVYDGEYIDEPNVILRNVADRPMCWVVLKNE